MFTGPGFGRGSYSGSESGPGPSLGPGSGLVPIRSLGPANAAVVFSFFASHLLVGILLSGGLQKDETPAAKQTLGFENNASSRVL